MTEKFPPLHDPCVQAVRKLLPRPFEYGTRGDAVSGNRWKDAAAQEIVAAVIAASPFPLLGTKFKCVARQTSVPEPQDCDWPTCSCDPYAEKVIVALQECGLLKETQGPCVPREPTEAMLDAARDWSYAKYGKPIGNDAANGCWKAMLAATPLDTRGSDR